MWCTERVERDGEEGGGKSTKSLWTPTNILLSNMLLVYPLVVLAVVVGRRGSLLAIASIEPVLAYLSEERRVKLL